MPIISLSVGVFSFSMFDQIGLFMFDCRGEVIAKSVMGEFSVLTAVHALTDVLIDAMVDVLIDVLVDALVDVLVDVAATVLLSC